MRVLVTRPEDDARTLVAALEARGHEALVAPMLTIAPTPGVQAPLDLDGVQALVFTSANGARVFARLSETRDLPVFTVGDASAAAARDAGFARVESAGGDVSDLARLIVRRLVPGDGALYQAAASRLAGDLKGVLEAAGFTLRRAVLYDATPVADLGAVLRRALADGGLDAASFFSPRSAETFVGLVEKLGLGEACARITALGLSDAVAAPLRRLAWRAVLVAERPTQEALLARLDDLAGAHHGGEETMNRPDAADTPGLAASANPQPDAEEAASTGARRIIARFGGIRPMAGKLGVAVSTVQGWRERGAIPPRHHQRLRAAAEAHGVEIDPQDLAEAARALQPPARDAPEPDPVAVVEPEPKTKTEPRAEAKQRAERRTERRTEQRIEQRPAPVRHDGGLGAWLGGAVLGALVLALGLGGAVIARDLWMPLVDRDYGAVDVGNLTGGELIAMERRVAALESARTASPSPGDAVAAAETLDRLGRGAAELAGRLETLEARVEGLASAPLAGDPASITRLAELSARIEELGALEQRLDALPELAERTGALAGRVEALAGLAERVAELPGALAALEQRVTELPGALAALEGRVDALARTRAGARGAPAGEAAFALAVQQLSVVLRGSGPFVEELALLRDLAASGAVEDGAALAREIAPLAPHAETGIPSLAGLDAAFPAVARAVVAQSRGGAGDDWAAGLLGRLSGLVTLRSLGPDGRVEGDDAGAVMARAGDQLEAGDLAAAVAELEPLQGPAAEAARSWRDQAAARLAARRVLTGLGRRLFARLEPTSG